MRADAKGRVLVVDDDPEICRLLVKRLTREEFYCESCSSGKEALELLDLGKFDAIISDLRVAGISGVDLLQATRKNHPNSAFLMATVEDDIRVGIEAMKQGAADYLVKPHDLDVVVASLGRALEKKRLEQQLENYRGRLEQIDQQRTRQLRAAAKRIEQTCDDTLETLAGALDLRDNETAGHSRRVSRYCLEIARAMNCSPKEMKQIARGSYLHDIGKIGIPDSILRKPAILTDKEMAVMQTHARIGYDLVSRIAFLAPVAKIVLTPQERFDGTSNPQGLAGNEIPLGARIFAVADTVDAMTSDRPYRRALSFADARAEIIRESGRQFDPEVVRAYLSLPEDTWETIRLEVAGLRARGDAGSTRAPKPAATGSAAESPSSAAPKHGSTS